VSGPVLANIGKQKEAAMSDDKSKRRPQDSKRINLSEEYEVDYWCERFGCTEAELRYAAQKVGPLVDDVKDELKVGGKQA
jgi:hypothetical protein